MLRQQAPRHAAERKKLDNEANSQILSEPN